MGTGEEQGEQQCEGSEAATGSVVSGNWKKSRAAGTQREVEGDEGERAQTLGFTVRPLKAAQYKSLSFDKAERTLQGVKCVPHSQALHPLNSPPEKGLAPSHELGN